MTVSISVAAWAKSLGISRQAGHQAVKRCGIPVVAGKVDPVMATRLYHERTQPRLPNMTQSPRPRPRPATMFDGQVALVHKLMGLADAELQAGRPLGDIEAPLRAALRALPLQLRRSLPVIASVWEALCADALACLAGETTPEEREEAASGQQSDEDTLMVTDWLYTVAAGELSYAHWRPATAVKRPPARMKAARA